jgi:hypothetical protein
MVRVDMAICGASPCAFGIGVYEKRPAAEINTRVLDAISNAF